MNNVFMVVLTKSGKLKWTDNSVPFCKEFTLNIGTTRIVVDETHFKAAKEGALQYYHTHAKDGYELYNAICDSMPDIQTLFDEIIEEIEK